LGDLSNGNSKSEPLHRCKNPKKMVIEIDLGKRHEPPIFRALPPLYPHHLCDKNQHLWDNVEHNV